MKTYPRFKTLFALFLVTLSFCSCRRSSSDLVEDTRSAGRYMGRGLRSLAGTNTDSRQIDQPSDFQGPAQEQYIPLNDEDLESPRSRSSAYPQSMESPGEMGSQLPGIEGFRDPVALDLESIFQHVHFDTDDAIVRGRENTQILKDVASYLQQHSHVYVFIEGHCDERASEAYNLALGVRRSNSVREFLIKEGVSTNRLFTVSYGNLRPLSLGHAPQDWKKNRRAQFKLYEKHGS